MDKHEPVIREDGRIKGCFITFWRGLGILAFVVLFVIGLTTLTSVLVRKRQSGDKGCTTFITDPISLPLSTGKDNCIDSRYLNEMHNRMTSLFSDMENKTRDMQEIQRQIMVNVSNFKKRNGAHELKPSSIVAFYAYLKSSIEDSEAGQTVIFDVVETNKGSGYNGKTGMFTVPLAGMYVFTWTISCDHSGRVFTELRVNSKSVGNILTQGSNSREYRTVTGVAVTEVNAGDTVLVRTNPKNGKPSGDIASYFDQKTAFSGWKLNKLRGILL